MALTRSKKEQLLDQYENGIAKADHAFVVGYKGITVTQDTDLRSRIRDQGGHYEVVKNTLARKAVTGKALEGLQSQFQGPTAIAYSEDPVSLAKALTEFAKEVPVLEFKGGVVDGQVVGADQVENIAKLPGRDDLIAKLLFLLQSPITRLARGLAAIPQQLVIVLDQIEKQKGGQG